MIPLREKIGYALGDAASGGITWKIMSVAFPLFFTNVFGLTFADAAALMLLARMFDVVTDPLMGSIADRTQSRRKSFHMLSGIVNNQMSFDLRNGDVFIFINKNRNRIKLLRKEPGGLVIYAMMLDYGRFHLPAFEEGMTSHALVWRDLDRMIRRIVDDPNYRLRCLRSGIRKY